MTSAGVSITGNIFISVQDIYEQGQVNTATSSVFYEAAYVFQNRVRLIVTSIVCFAIILARLIALLWNATSAILGVSLESYIHGNGVLNQLARKSSVRICEWRD